MILEVCANSLESAINAEKAGATRIELCAELGVGGVTPSYGLLKQVLKAVNIPVHVLIRPRSGDFTYSKSEFEVMKQDIALCVELGCAGIVTGVLCSNFTVDIERTKLLIDASNNLQFTFHRAFDWVVNPELDFLNLQEIGVNYLLSSGQKTSAVFGISLLSKLNKIASSCVVMPGGGLRVDNVVNFKNEGFKALHMSGVALVKTLNSDVPLSMISNSFLEENKIAVSSVETIQQVVALLNKS
ncbi:copper homeostasis protein CutC [Cellulophaga omnivescoria]|uniref:copper homeostasis protein CutC n=1 Tax=Cellulophaga omnivescoria TaxID=1888890 RepID=UPI0009877002|nr:copper homeostasis protein CutC [Cellulophaga omnivescoria]WBU88038.1 copper homeostasis protein CutC [Cellulophaga omnivescoria]